MSLLPRFRRKPFVQGMIAVHKVPPVSPPKPSPPVPARNAKRNRRQKGLLPTRSSARLQTSVTRQGSQDADGVEPKVDNEQSLSHTVGKRKRGPGGPAAGKETKKRLKTTHTPTTIGAELEGKVQRQPTEGPQGFVGSQRARFVTRSDGRVLLRLVPSDVKSKK